MLNPNTNLFTPQCSSFGGLLLQLVECGGLVQSQFDSCFGSVFIEMSHGERIKRLLHCGGGGL